jgi:hypothetical protein
MKWPSSKFLYPQIFDMSGRRIVTDILRTENLSSDLNLLDIDSAVIEMQHIRSSPNKSREISESTKTLISNVFSREIAIFYESELNYKKLTYDWRLDAVYCNGKLIEREF